MNEVDDDRYDLIFMDIQMPKMDGYMTTREIPTLKNNKKANIPIVAMTANAFEEDKRDAIASGMNGYIENQSRLISCCRYYQKKKGNKMRS